MASHSIPPWKGPFVIPVAPAHEFAEALRLVIPTPIDLNDGGPTPLTSSIRYPSRSFAYRISLCTKITFDYLSSSLLAGDRARGPLLNHISSEERSDVLINYRNTFRKSLRRQDLLSSGCSDSEILLMKWNALSCDENQTTLHFVVECRLNELKFIQDLNMIY
jgi:hypothetical protein